MKKRTIAMFLSVALCLSVALTGCGADKSQQSDPADDGKKSLTIAVLNDVVSLDPAVKDSSAEMQMASHLYDPLVDYDADLSKKPGLAESWKVLDDGDVGVQASPGREVLQRKRLQCRRRGLQL